MGSLQSAGCWDLVPASGRLYTFSRMLHSASLHSYGGLPYATPVRSPLTMCAAIIFHLARCSGAVLLDSVVNPRSMHRVSTSRPPGATTQVVQQQELSPSFVDLISLCLDSPLAYSSSGQCPCLIEIHDMFRSSVEFREVSFPMCDHVHRGCILRPSVWHEGAPHVDV